MNIKVTSDSTCDLPKELLEQYNIDLVPLIIMREEEEFLDNVTITPNDIFSHVDAGGNLCTTAARSVAVYEELFAKYAKDYDGVIHISLGSGFSSSCQNALVAAQITLVGCNVYTRKNLEDAVAAIASNKVDVGPLISRVFDIEECAQAFQLLNSRDKSVAKVLFKLS